MDYTKKRLFPNLSDSDVSTKMEYVKKERRKAPLSISEIQIPQKGRKAETGNCIFLLLEIPLRGMC
jgi:hypothetical protein